MDIKIEKGIAMPSMGQRGGIIKLIESLEIGDSFLGNQSIITNLRTTAKRRGMLHKFTGRQTEDGYRIWLLSK